MKDILQSVLDRPIPHLLVLIFFVLCLFVWVPTIKRYGLFVALLLGFCMILVLGVVGYVLFLAVPGINQFRDVMGM